VDTDIRHERFRGPVRDAPILVRLTQEERKRLQEFALRRDLHAGQAARWILNERLGTANADTDGPHDGRAAQ